VWPYDACQVGAQASKVQFDRVLSYLELGRSEGAVAVAGGRAARVPRFDDGLFVEPTLFQDVRNEMRIAQEEIFGPVTCFLSWDDEAEMIRQVNDSPYGLGGGIWTHDLARAHRLSRAMQTGMIWINRYFNFKPGQPIGGYKQSGFGRENTFDTLQHYTITKSVVVNLAEGPLGIFQ
jgi:acyl-CoA reductase-like NAD-dependent aldehyde dehydrogenase